MYGAVLGAIGVNYAKTWFTGAFPEFWLFALGGLFVGWFVAAAVLQNRDDKKEDQ